MLSQRQSINKSSLKTCHNHSHSIVHKASIFNFSAYHPQLEILFYLRTRLLNSLLSLFLHSIFYHTVGKEFLLHEESEKTSCRNPQINSFNKFLFNKYACFAKSSNAYCSKNVNARHSSGWCLYCRKITLFF